jgi:outer membrane biosynthesis protein TonB
LATTARSEKSIYLDSGAPSARALLTSTALHVLALALLMLVPAEALLHSAPPKELNVVLYRPRPPLPVVPAPAVPPPPQKEPAGGGPKQKPPEPSAPVPKPAAPPGPQAPGPVAEAPGKKIGRAGILAFRDQFASLAQDKPAPRLGADARYGNAAEVGQPSSRTLLTTNAPGESGGINQAGLSRNVGGGGGGGGGGGLKGLGVGKATSSIAGIGGGDRPLSRGGPGPSRTDEEIQIVFDRYKAAFYRIYNRELRKDPTLRGQMVLRLTIEPDGSVSMCVLQSSDMNAPDLAAEVVSRVKTINFGAKEGVQAVTIVYPIDFLPAE